MADEDSLGGSASAPRRLTWHRANVALPPPGETRTFELRSRRLLLCNAAGTPYVIEDSCPHVRVSMAGAVLDGCVLECPHHGGRLDVRDGRPVRLPIRRGVGTYAVRVSAEGAVEVAIEGGVRSV